MHRILAICCFILGIMLGTSTTLQAQNDQTAVEFSAEPQAQPEVEMADTLRQDGKIYVVVVVLLTVLAGLIVYLVSLDRKVSKLEKQFRE
ncbi:hypothetical protein LN893_13035 [Pontibacter sp. XAAS-A31]|nr:hypothetical protein [Pontibacter harenae]MCC9167770.1 hypothetical protein [Pontibacter harenae]